jgi:hypothetical protein
MIGKCQSGESYEILDDVDFVQVGHVDREPASTMSSWPVTWADSSLVRNIVA